MNVHGLTQIRLACDMPETLSFETQIELMGARLTAPGLITWDPPPTIATRVAL
jgi:hypothetical protein